MSTHKTRMLQTGLRLVEPKLNLGFSGSPWKNLGPGISFPSLCGILKKIHLVILGKLSGIAATGLEIINCPSDSEASSFPFTCHACLSHKTFVNTLMTKWESQRFFFSSDGPLDLELPLCLKNTSQVLRIEKVETRCPDDQCPGAAHTWMGYYPRVNKRSCSR